MARSHYNAGKATKAPERRVLSAALKVGEKDRQDADVFDGETIKNSHAVLVLKHRNNEQRTTRGHAQK